MAVLGSVSLAVSAVAVFFAAANAIFKVTEPPRLEPSVVFDNTQISRNARA